MRSAYVAGELREAFPLVPRHRPRGHELGALRGARRGLGSEVSGIRPYEPGDDVRRIDWAASARLSAARGTDEFLVREHDADLAPRVVLVVDRRPAMELYAAPWLSKRAAAGLVERLVSASAQRERALTGLVEVLPGRVAWHAPVARPTERARAGTDHEASGDELAHALRLLLHERPLPAGSFVFLVSDFLGPVPEPELCSCATRMLDVVPVVVQDPTWEGSFPVEVGGLVLPLADAAGTRLADVRVTRAEARARRERNEARRAALLARLLELGHEPVLVEDGRPDAVLSAFLGWASGRLAARGRAA